MSKKEEMANKYAEEHGFRVPYDGSDNFYDDVDVKASKEGFIAGANAVLEEIEKVLNTPIADYAFMVAELKNRIEQLKKE